MTASVRSVIRWAGSKRKILPVLRDAYERSGSKGMYIEPFAGSAALFFELQPGDAVLSDANEDLIAALRRLVSDPEGVFLEVNRMPLDISTYYKVRAYEPNTQKRISKEARFFYLNRLCFNGIYRTNKKGEFNVPYGGEKSGAIPPLERWIACAGLLSKAKIIVGDFRDVVMNHVEHDSFVYLDPPYAVSNRRIFKQYAPNEFGVDDVHELRSLLDEIDRRGAKFLVSYAQSPETKIISNGWSVRRTTAQRNIAGFSEHRRKATEVLISNF